MHGSSSTLEIYTYTIYRFLEYSFQYAWCRPLGHIYKSPRHQKPPVSCSLSWALALPCWLNIYIIYGLPRAWSYVVPLPAVNSMGTNWGHCSFASIQQSVAKDECVCLILPSHFSSALFSSLFTANLHTSSLLDPATASVWLEQGSVQNLDYGHQERGKETLVSESILW
jgi:hypothetical protein